MQDLEGERGCCPGFNNQKVRTLQREEVQGVIIRRHRKIRDRDQKIPTGSELDLALDQFEEESHHPTLDGQFEKRSLLLRKSPGECREKHGLRHHQQGHLRDLEGGQRLRNLGEHQQIVGQENHFEEPLHRVSQTEESQQAQGLLFEEEAEQLVGIVGFEVV